MQFHDQLEVAEMLRERVSGHRSAFESLLTEVLLSPLVRRFIDLPPFAAIRLTEPLAYWRADALEESASRAWRSALLSPLPPPKTS